MDRVAWRVAGAGHAGGAMDVFSDIIFLKQYVIQNETIVKTALKTALKGLIAALALTPLIIA